MRIIEKRIRQHQQAFADHEFYARTTAFRFDSGLHHSRGFCRWWLTTSDLGPLLLKGVDRQIGLTERVCAAIDDTRHPSYVTHTLHDILKQRICQIACGYEDGNDCNSLRHDPVFRLGAGSYHDLGALALAGDVVALSGVIAFRRAKTTLNPMKPDNTASLITGGNCRFTRNPMYLGLLLVLIAFAVHLSSAWLLVGPVIFVLYINRFQVVPEERVLSRIFGESYCERSYGQSRDDIAQSLQRTAKWARRR